jgi:O-antigen ligase
MASVITAERIAPRLRTIIAFASFVCLGLLLSAISFRLFVRFGFLAAIIVVAVPIMLGAAIAALPELIRSVRSLKKGFAWQHCLWLLLFASAMDFRVRDYHDAIARPVDAWAVLRIGPELIVAVWLAYRWASGKSSLRYLFAGLPGTLTVFCTLALISAFWSVSPPWTIFKSLEYLLDLTVLAVILESVHSAEDYLKVLNWTWVLYALETSIAWVGAVVSPANAWDEDGRLRALYPLVGANIIGTTGALLTLVAISRLFWPGKRTDRAWYWTVCFFGIATMLVAQTRNAIGGFLLGLLVVCLFARRLWIAGAFVAFATPILMFTSAGGVVWTYLRRHQADQSLHSFTGRLDWWEYGWQQLAQHPYTGLGAFAGGKFGVLAKLGLAEATFLHSDWLDIAVGMSFWGVLLFAAAVVGTWWVLVKVYRSSSYSGLERQLAIECAGVMGLLTLHSFFNNELSWHCPLTFFAVLGYAEFLRRKTQHQRHRVAFESVSATGSLHPPLIGSQP